MAKAVSMTTGSKQKQQKMGHAKQTQETQAVLCGQGHPTHIVHHTHLRNMRRWCPVCLSTHEEPK